MDLFFEWDPDKASRNRRVHGVTFGEASTVFGDPLSMTFHDRLHSVLEERFILIGRSANGRLLVVVHSEQGDVVRIISARRAQRREQNVYEQATS